MFDFLTSGDVPTVVITVISLLLVGAYYIFVIPIYEENKKLKDSLKKSLSEAKDNLDEVNKKLKSIDRNTKSFLLNQENHFKPLLDKVDSHNTFQENEIEDLIENNKLIMESLKSHGETVRDILYIVSTIKDTQSNILSIIYSATKTDNSSERHPSRLK